MQVSTCLRGSNKLHKIKQTLCIHNITYYIRNKVLINDTLSNLVAFMTSGMLNDSRQDDRHNVVKNEGTFLLMYLFSQIKMILFAMLASFHSNGFFTLDPTNAYTQIITLKNHILL